MATTVGNSSTVTTIVLCQLEELSALAVAKYCLEEMKEVKEVRKEGNKERRQDLLNEYGIENSRHEFQNKQYTIPWSIAILTK